MKKLIFTFLLSTGLTFCLTAQDNTLIEQYCKLTANGKVFSKKYHVTLDFGDTERKWHKDYKLRDEQTGKPKEFNSVVDALNYMGAQGWTLVNAFPMTDDGTSASTRTSNSFHYYFKKLFKRSEIE